MKIGKALLWLALTLGCALYGCSQGHADAPQAAAAAPGDSQAGTEYVAAPDAKGIATMQVQIVAVPEYLEVPAHIDPDPTQVVHLFPPAGGRIMEMKVRPWDRVEKGQVVATLESADLSRAVADYHKAQADLAVKEKSLTRANDLLEHHAIAEKDFQQAEADAQASRAEVAATAEQIRVFGMDPEHASAELSLKAPRAGVVLDIGAAQGEFSNALAAPNPLCTIADISTVWAVGDIYEQDLALAKAGQQARVNLNAYPNDHWTGIVSTVSDTVDPATRTMHVRVVLPNPGERLKPSMYGTIRLLRSSRQGIVLPASAVIREGTEAYVYVAKGNGRYERRDVTLGRELDGSLEVTKGVSAGETVVSQGALLLRSAGQS